MEPSGWPSTRLQPPVVSPSPSPLPEHWLNSLESELESLQRSTLFEVGLPVGGSNTQNHGKLELLSVIYIVLTVYHLAINDSDDVQRSNTQSFQSLQAPAAGGGSHFDPSVSFPNSERQQDFDSDFDSALARLQAGGSESGSSLQPQLPGIGSDSDYEAPLTQSQLRPDSPQGLNFHHVVSFPAQLQLQLQTLIDDDHFEFQESQGPLVFQPSSLPDPQPQLQEYNATHRQAGTSESLQPTAGSSHLDLNFSPVQLLPFPTPLQRGSFDLQQAGSLQPQVPMVALPSSLTDGQQLHFEQSQAAPSESLPPMGSGHVNSMAQVPQQSFSGSQDLDSQQAGSEQAANHLSHSNHSKCCV